MPGPDRLKPSLIALALVLASALSFPAPAAADDKLVVIGGSVATGFFEVLEHVAQRAGFYKEEHLDVENQYVVGAQIAAQLVASGKGDVCSLAIEPLIQGYDKGLRLKAFFSRDPVYDYALAVLSTSPIHTLADFKGATLGEISPNSPAEISVNSMLQGAGLKKSDVSYIPIGNGAQAISALTSGKVAGAAFPYPELLIYESVAPITFRYFHHPILKDIGNVGYAATPDTIATKADALRRFARAHVKAAIFVRENPALAARYFLEGAGMAVTPDALRNETRLLVLSQGQLPGADPMSDRIGEMPLLGIDVYSKFMNANGLVNAVVPASAVVTNEFIPYANAFDHTAFIARAKAMR
jgi:NitT/TauT family transport system substrate-binding protein